VIPGGLWLIGLEEKLEKDKGNQLRMVGAAFSATAVADFMSNLRKSEKFKDVDLIVSRQDLTKTPPLVNFEVICAFSL
jgi:Tfp pilus assembly protein PilN